MPSPQKPITALPDVTSTPSESKKVKLFHVDGQEDGVGSDEAKQRPMTDETEQERGGESPKLSERGLVDGAEDRGEKMDVDNVGTSDSGSGFSANHTPPPASAPAPVLGSASDTILDGTDSPSSPEAGPSTINGSFEHQNQLQSPDLGDGEREGDVDADEPSSPTVVPVPLAEEPQEEEWFGLTMQWCGKSYALNVAGNDMVYDFRTMIESLTQVPRDTQKLIGLLPKNNAKGKGKLGTEFDALRFGSLGVKQGVKFVMIGTPEADRFKDPSKGEGGTTDDFDVTYSSGKNERTEKAMTQADDPRNQRKVKEIIERIPITVMNEPREGKKLLVLDLDYTIVDTKPLISGALPSSECARPGLHEFLEQVYPHYDIVVWSQTHWRWLEAKLVELGIVGGEGNYKVSFVSDRTTMFPVFTTRNGQPYKHEVKPLAYFWASFPQWSAKNTVHIDDLARNFALNPGEGLRIRAYNKAGQAEGMADRELWRLGTYLVNIASNVEDFTSLDHSQWKKVTPK